MKKMNFTNFNMNNAIGGVSFRGLLFVMSFWLIGTTLSAQDNCASATALTVGAGSCSGNEATADNTGASDSGDATPSCANFSGGDLWFSVVVPASGTLVVETSDAGGFTDSGMSLYTGTCGSLTQFECNDDGGDGTFSKIELSVADGLAGQTVFLQVWEYGNNSFGNVSICAYEPPAPPANDDCAGAYPFTDDFTVSAEGGCTGTTSMLDLAAATQDIGVNDEPSCDDFDNIGVWYTWTATSTGLTFTTGDGEPGFVIFEAGTCGSLTEVGCINNDDGQVGGLTIGDDYIIHIYKDGFQSTDVVTFCLEELDASPPDNDDCADATPLVFDEVADGSNSFASDSGVDDPGCANYSGGDTWFSVVMPDAGNVTITTGYDGDSFDSGLAVYSGDCGALTLLACDDDANDFGDDVQSLSSRVVIEDPSLIGQTLYVRVWEFGNNNTGDFTVLATFAACTLTCPGDIAASADAGVCEAFVQVPLPTLTGACASPTMLLTEGFDACALPAGWATDFVGVGAVADFSGISDCGTPGQFHFDCTEQPPAIFVVGPPASFDGCVATLNDDQAGPVFVGTLYITSPVVDLSAAVSPMLTLDYQNVPFFLTAGGGRFTVEGFDGADWVEVFGTDQAENGSLALDLSAFSNADFQVRFGYDDQGQWAWGASVDNVNIMSFDGAGTAEHDSPFADNPGEDASGTYPVGTTTVTYTSFTLTGDEVTCSFDVTVTDDEDPIVTINGQPLDADILVDLGPGECDAVVNFTVEVSDNCPGAVLVDNNALGSGDAFPIGVTVLTYGGTDASGNTAEERTVTVTVNEFANPTATLACNDLVQVSLDETCTAIIGADDILEGGPYGCYDDYIVMVLSNLGQDLGDVVDYTFVGNGQYTVRVTDPETGNNCWGHIIVEDKLIPVIECDDLTVNCTADLTPVDGGTNTFTNNTVVAVGPNPGTVTSTITASGMPANATIFDVKVSLDITHTWVGDLDISLTSPDGTTIDLFSDQCNGSNRADVDVTLDDQSGNPFTCAAAGVSPNIAGTMETPGLTISDLAGGLANGNWVLTVADDAFGDGGTLNSVSLEIAWLSGCGDVLAATATDNCNSPTLTNGRLTYSDSYVDGSCGGPSRTITRTWNAVDLSGNEAVPCVQTITQSRPSLDDVATPANVTWSCQQYAWWPNIIEATHLHPYFQDCDAATTTVELTCYDHTCNDNALNDPAYCDNPKIDNTQQFGCTLNPGNCTSQFNVPNPGLENEDIFALTGSGVPTVGGNPLADICEIGVDVEDITIEICPGTFKIVRKWTLIDWCADPVDVREVTQVVKVVDETAPSIAAPAGTLTSPYIVDVYDASAPGAAPHAVCEGSVVVPPAGGVADDCSGISGYTTEIWAIDAAGAPVSLLGSVPTNGGIFFDIPLYINGLPARYVVRYYAVDGCGNQASDDTYIRLNDRVPPVAICDEITEVSITNNGPNIGASCSTLWAEDLDDGSYDNCSPVFFLISDMSSTNPALWQFRPSIDYCCEDLGDNMAVVAVVANNGTTSAYVDNFLNNLGYVPGNSLVNSSSAAIIGQVNTCMVEVEVTDKLAPVLISCPADTRILCDHYAATLETQLANAANDQEACDVLTAAGYGEATFLDNCSLNVNCDFTDAIDQCLEGFVRRRWTASDDAGNNSLQTCTQRIFVDHVSDWAVVFPDDITVDCGTSVPDFGEPEIFFETCELVAISYEDELFTTVPDACYKILRTWQVINWCVVGDDIDQEVEELSEAELWLAGITNLSDRDINADGFFSSNVNSKSGRTFRDSWNGVAGLLNKPVAANATQSTNPDTDLDSDPWDGYITYQQVIKVIDDVDPVFTNGCEIPQVCIEDNTCGATVLLPTPEIDECSDNVNLTAQITIGGATLNGFGPYLNVSPGVYNVRYVAMDNCNNQTACETTVTVADCKKPTPYCKNGIIIEIMQTGMVDVWATDLNDNSFDNCPGALKYSFSSDVDDIGITFTCDDLGQQPVELWVTDAAGNQDYCETFVIIQDNMFSCEGDDPIIAGITATEENLGVEGVNININSPSGFTANVTTDASGNYTVNNGLVAGNDYTVTPVLDVDPLNGITTFDLVLISKHILGVQALDSPYKIIAADANRSNSLTTFDMVQIRKLILFIDTEFANNTSWRFFDANCTFSNPTDPFSDMCSEVFSINDIPVGTTMSDFVAVKVGDVNGTAATNLLGSASDRTMVGDLVLDVEDMDVQKGERYTVDFKATDFNVSGYQFTLNFDNKVLDFVEVGAGLANASNFGLSMVEEGVLTASWNSNEAKKMTAGEVVFSLTFDANQNGQLSDLLGLNSRYTVAEAYNADAQLLNVALSFNSDVVANGFELFQNTPNPFASTTAIGFYLPEATSATLTISDVQGKVVKVINGDFAEGYNTVNLKRGDLNANGVLYYRLDAGADSATRMMILVD